MAESAKGMAISLAGNPEVAFSAMDQSSIAGKQGNLMNSTVKVAKDESTGETGTKDRPFLSPLSVKRHSDSVDEDGHSGKLSKTSADQDLLFSPSSLSVSIKESTGDDDSSIQSPESEIGQTEISLDMEEKAAVSEPPEAHSSERMITKEDTYYEVLKEFKDHFLMPNSALVWLTTAAPTRSFKLPVPKHFRWPRAIGGQGGYADAFRKLGFVLRATDTKSGHWHYWYLDPKNCQFREVQKAVIRHWRESPANAAEDPMFLEAALHNRQRAFFGKFSVPGYPNSPAQMPGPHHSIPMSYVHHPSYRYPGYANPHFSPPQQVPMSYNHMPHPNSGIPHYVDAPAAAFPERFNQSNLPNHVQRYSNHTPYYSRSYESYHGGLPNPATFSMSTYSDAPYPEIASSNSTSKNVSPRGTFYHDSSDPWNHNSSTQWQSGSSKISPSGASSIAVPSGQPSSFPDYYKIRQDPSFHSISSYHTPNDADVPMQVPPPSESGSMAG